MELAAVVAVSFLSGFLSGTIGFASGVLPAALLSLVIPSDTAVPLLAPIVLAGAAVALTFHWKAWEGRHVLIVLPPLLLGTWLGTVLLSEASALLINRVIAAFVIVIALQEIGRRFAGERTPSRLRRAAGSLGGGLLLGLVGGIASAVAHAGGVVVVTYLISADLKRSAFVGTVLCVLVLADTAKLLAFLQAGLLTGEMAGPIAWSLPFLLLGVYGGRRVYHRLPAGPFRMVVAATLLGLGIFLLV